MRKVYECCLRRRGIPYYLYDRATRRMVVLVPEYGVDGMTEAYAAFQKECLEKELRFPGLCDYHGAHYIRVEGDVLDESDEDILLKHNRDLCLAIV